MLTTEPHQLSLADGGIGVLVNGVILYHYHADGAKWVALVKKELVGDGIEPLTSWSRGYR